MKVAAPKIGSLQSMRSLRSSMGSSRSIGSVPDADAELPFVLPPTPDWFASLQGHRLHVRLMVPSSAKKAKAVAFFLHRVGGHTNRSTKVAFAKSLTKHGVATILLDFHGHGYSGSTEPSERCNVRDCAHLVDDAELLVDVFALGQYKYLDDDMACIHMDEEREEMLERISSLPFVIIAEATAAPVALLTGLRLRQRERPLALFMGVALLSGCLKMPSVGLLEGFTGMVVGDQASSGRVPAHKDKFLRPDLLWEGEEQQRAEEEGDELAWRGPMRTRTYNAMSTMMKAFHARLSLVDFALLAVHDPVDEVASYSSIQALAKGVRTGQWLDSKRVEVVRGGKHDVIANKPGPVLDAVVEWIFNQKMEQSERWAEGN